MPWDDFTLNDGTKIPSIAYGTWKLGGGDSAVDYVDQALSVGFSHIDTAQIYANEHEAGRAIADSGLPRSALYITTKFSGADGKGVDVSIRESLQKLNVPYVDLYLIHSPRLAQPDIPTIWKQMEAVVDQGFAKSIGVSNFNAAQLGILLASARIKPVANQILFHPSVLAQQLPIHEFGTKNGVITEGYSTLIPITQTPNGPVSRALGPIADSHKATKDQILLAWAKAKGVLVVTSSRKKERLEGYLNAGDIDLSPTDIRTIDLAGALSARQLTVRTLVRRAAVLGLVTAGVLGVCAWAGVDVI